LGSEVRSEGEGKVHPQDSCDHCGFVLAIHDAQVLRDATGRMGRDHRWWTSGSGGNVIVEPLVIAMTTSVSSASTNALLQPFISPSGTFLLFPVVCGGLNAVMIYGLLSAIERKKHP
jgi:hypothetical protein